MDFNGRLTYTKSLRGKKAAQSLDFTQSVETPDVMLAVNCAALSGGSRITVILTPKTEIEICECRLMTSERLEEQNPIFLNGYQTWTDSRETTLHESIPKLNKLLWPITHMYGDYSFYPYRRNKLQSWTYTYIRHSENQHITLYGSLNEYTGYTAFEYDKIQKSLSVLKDCKGLVPQVGKPYDMFDIFTAYGEENEAFDCYFAAAEIPKPRVQPCTGWTSWYNYYTNVTQKDILENLNAFRSQNIPIDILQIDDGYQQAVGDWLNINNKFPSGMRYLAQEIQKSGYKAGLWLAPLICEKTSRIYREHPDWVLGKAGFNPGWSGIFYVLDFYNEGVRDYLRDVFDTVLNQWNYDMVKLDFLYAAALIPRKDKTRGQVMYECMRFLRETAGDKIILGCGVPLGCSFGLVDYCRVSSDVALKWEDRLLAALHYRERVSTSNALTSTIGRRHLNGRAFYNDPDVFILRNDSNQLSKDQRYTLFLINRVLGGLVFTSDNIKEYTEGQMKLYQTLFTLKDKVILRAEMGDLFQLVYTAGGKPFCLISNLTAKNVETEAPCTGMVQNADEPNIKISKGQKLKLRPYQSVCIQTDYKRFSKISNIFTD